jgi:hypothetical protein
MSEQDEYEIKYLPSFQNGIPQVVTVRVYPDGRREAVSSDWYPSVSQTEKVFDTFDEALDAAAKRWGGARK